ncbi:MAG: YtxH domain-containing protein [Rhodobacterales bacterium]|nr:YtxH domain-containing protein [Rhodobacterales bacterium]
MNTQNTEFATNAMKSAADNMRGMFNMQGSQNALKTWASMSERMTAVFVEAGTRSTDIMSDAAKEALANLADAMQVRDEPADYSKAYSDFAQKQMTLLQHTVKEVGEVTQAAGTEASKVTSEVGEEMRDKISANVKDAADKAGSAGQEAYEAGKEMSDKVAETAKYGADKGTEAAKDAADKGAAIAKDTASKAGSAAKKTY